MNKTLTAMASTLLLAWLLLLSGCANQSTSRCDDLSPDEKEACMDAIYKAMEDYKRQQQETVENPRY